MRRLMEKYLDLLEASLLGTMVEDPPIDPWHGRVTEVSDTVVTVEPGKYDARARKLGKDWPQHALTMIGQGRMRNLREAVLYVLDNAVEGDFIETGVWRGGASVYMAGIYDAWGETVRAGDKKSGRSPLLERRIFVCDSFEGLPKPEHSEDKGDVHHVYPQLAVSVVEVQQNFRRFDLLHLSMGEVLFVKGWFKDTLPLLMAEVRDGGCEAYAQPKPKFSIVRLDGDMYGSTMDGLVNLYPALVANGFLIVDDYHAVKGCKKAVDEYRELHNIAEPIREIDGTGVYWQK